MLSARADTISRYLVFFGRGQTPLTAASRGGRLLMDLGRVDTRVKSRARRKAFQEAVAALSPIRTGDRFRVRGPWGADDAVVTGFDEWNGRIVATLDVPPAVDSLARRKEPLVAVATRIDTVRVDSASAPPHVDSAFGRDSASDSAATAVKDTCPRDSVSAELLARVQLVSDSIGAMLMADTAALPERLTTAVSVQTTQVIGCFGPGRVLLAVTLRAGDYEHVRESIVLIDARGGVTPLRVSDLRFKAHELLHALDADGDGVDDVATRGRVERAGGTSVLRLNVKARRLERLTGGFAWETF